MDGDHENELARAASWLGGADRPVALTGAGVSTESGIADFRSPGGLWSRFDPMEVATLDAFIQHPDQAWVFYRELDRALRGRRPNPAHEALARLEAAGRLAGIITQNIDGLHQAAGSRVVLEIHGSHGRLQCLRCSRRTCMDPAAAASGAPRCPACGFPLKPDVVLFGESVRAVPAARALLADCDLLLVAGTSCEVTPAGSFPLEVAARGGRIVEVNLEPSRLSEMIDPERHCLLQGAAGSILPRLACEVIGERRPGAGPAGR